MAPLTRVNATIGLRTLLVLLSSISLICATAFIVAVSDVVHLMHPNTNMIPLDEAIRIAVIYTLFGMWIMFGILFFSLHLSLLDPISKLASSLHAFTNHKDWAQRVGSVTRIKELNSLVEDFNLLVGTVEHDHNQLREVAIQDSLTGLFNRRGFETHLDETLDRARRFNSSFSIVMVDLDNFKPINDTYGHPAGDFILRKLAERIQGELRTVDIFARIGGDEFVIILPETYPAGAITVAEKLHNAFNSALFPIDASNDVRIPLTASLGVACYPRDGSDKDSLQHAVDEVLYRAKRAGKNCIVSLNEGGASI